MPFDTTTPKDRFTADKIRVEAHRLIVTHAQFEDSINTALLEFQQGLARGKMDVTQAAANHFQMAGALEFVRILRNLSEIPTATRAPAMPTLNHQA